MGDDLLGHHQALPGSRPATQRGRVDLADLGDTLATLGGRRLARVDALEGGIQLAAQHAAHAQVADHLVHGGVHRLVDAVEIVGDQVLAIRTEYAAHIPRRYSITLDASPDRQGQILEGLHHLDAGQLGGGSDGVRHRISQQPAARQAEAEILSPVDLAEAVQRHVACIVGACLNHAKDVVIGSANDRNLGGSRIRVSLLAIESLLADDVGQVVAADTMPVQLVDDVALEGSGSHLDRGRPVVLGPHLVELFGALLHAGASDCLVQFLEGRQQLRTYSIQRRPGALGEGRIGLVSQEVIRLTTGPAQVVVERMPPLMGQRAGAIGLGQVDDYRVALIVGLGRIGPACSTRPEGKAQFAVQRQGARRHVEDAGQIHQAVIGVIQILDPALVLDVVAELHAPEAEGFSEQLGRHVLAVAVVGADARGVVLVAGRRRGLHRLVARLERGLIVLQVVQCLANAVELLHPDQTLAILLGDE
ncbi:hypothetical protein D3C78_559680 [compost metagenome]